MGAMTWLHYRHNQSVLMPRIGLVALSVSSLLLWRGWKLAYVMLCAATGLGALTAFLVDGRSSVKVFGVGMNGFAFVNLMLPVTRSFLAEQRRKYGRAGAGSSVGS